jgi:hypothetical protein
VRPGQDAEDDDTRREAGVADREQQDTPARRGQGHQQRHGRPEHRGRQDRPGTAEPGRQAGGDRGAHQAAHALGGDQDADQRRRCIDGVSTQRPDELAAFARSQDIGFPLLSDADLDLVTALRLPTFRAVGVDRLKRLTLLLDRERIVRGVLYPIADPAGSVDDALALLDARAHPAA